MHKTRKAYMRTYLNSQVNEETLIYSYYLCIPGLQLKKHTPIGMCLQNFMRSFYRLIN